MLWRNENGVYRPASTCRMFQVNQLVGFGGGGKNEVKFAFVTATQDGSNITAGEDYTFAGVSIGDPANKAQRRVHVGVVLNGTAADPSTPTVTVGGVSTTINVESVSDGGATRYCGITTTDDYISSGTTATVVVDPSVACTSGYIVVWYSTGLTNANAHATATDTRNLANPSSLSATVATKVGGFALGMVRSSNSATFTWTGLTENDDTTIDAPVTGSGASVETDGTNLTVTATGSGGANAENLNVASFG